MAGRRKLPEYWSPAKRFQKRLQPDRDSSESNWLGSPSIGKRKRIVLPHKSGFTIMRRVWLFAPSVAGLGKAKLTSAGVELPWKTSWGAVVQVATHFFPDLSSFLSETWMSCPKRGCHEGGDGER